MVVSESDKEPVSGAKESVQKQTRLLKLTKARQSSQLPKMVMLAIAWVVFAWAFYSAWQAKINYKPYDPFEILGISSVSGSSCETTLTRPFSVELDK